MNKSISKMRNVSKKIVLGLLTSIILLTSLVKIVNAESQVCIVYFTGMGCPHCAKTDPVVLETLPKEYGKKIVIIEYEIYKNRDNVPIFQSYDSVYKTGLSIPLVIFRKDDFIVGDTPIIQNIRKKIDDYLVKGGNPCSMIDGSSIPFSEVNTENLPGSPNILSGNKVQNSVSGKFVEPPMNLNWVMIGGIMAAIIVIVILLKIRVKLKMKVD